MARLPRYMKMSLGGTTTDERGRPAVQATIRIAWWGWPVLLWQTIRQEYRIRWWQWPHVLWVVLRISVQKLLATDG